MEGFGLWVLLESGRFDRAEYNSLFRHQLDELRRRITDPERLETVERLAAIDWAAYILAAVRRAGVRHPGDQEAAAHDIVVRLLLKPGALFRCDPDHGPPLDARFRAAVRNAVTNLRRSRARDRDDHAIGIGHEPGQVSPETIPNRKTRHADDEEWWAALRDYIRREVGPLGVRLLDLMLAGRSLRSLVTAPEFSEVGEWGVRRVWERVRAAATKFVRWAGMPVDEGVGDYIRTWTSDSMSSGSISAGRAGVSPLSSSTSG